MILAECGTRRAVTGRSLMRAPEHGTPIDTRHRLIVRLERCVDGYWYELARLEAPVADAARLARDWVGDHGA